MTLKFYQANEQRFQFIKLLLYGEPGVGKTLTSCIDARGIPSPGPILFINVEAGTMSIRNVSDVTIIDLKPDPNDPLDIDPKSGKILRDGVDKLSLIYAHLQSGKHSFKTVVVDSITELQKLFLDRACRDAGKTLPELRQWGVAQERTRNALRMFRDLPMNVVLIALSQEVKDDISGEITIKPSLSGKVADEVAAFMDEVAYMKKTTVQLPPKEEGGQPVTEVRRVWVMDGGEKIIAKDRSGVLPAMLPASFAYMWEQIYGKQDAAEDDRLSALS